MDRKFKKRDIHKKHKHEKRRFTPQKKSLERHSGIGPEASEGINFLLKVIR